MGLLKQELEPFVAYFSYPYRCTLQIPGPVIKETAHPYGDSNLQLMLMLVDPLFL